MSSDAVENAYDKFVPRPEEITDSKIGVRDKANLQAEFVRMGDGLAKSLRDRADLRPESCVLDMGCGMGRVARPLVGYLTTGSYYGIDVVKSSIDWCNRVYADVPNFKFIYADLFSTYYNPEASVRAEDYKFPFEDGTFDVIWSSSLFTHLEFRIVDHYLEEMARTLKPGGRVWNSYLLLDELSEPHVLEYRPDGRWMKFPVEGGRVTYKNSPETVIALYKDRVFELHEKHGLEIVRVGLSNWSGGRPGVSYKGQDIIIARKPA